MMKNKTKVSNKEDKAISLANEEFQNYYDALCEDNADKVEEIFQNTKDKNALLNGYFDFGDMTKCAKWHYLKAILVKPLHIAIVNGSKNVAAVLLEHGADPSQIDVHGNTIIHSLIAEAMLSQETESRSIDMYDWLIQTLGKEVYSRLLREENDLGLRPVEYAAKLGTLRLLKNILYTDGVYVAKTVTNGSKLLRWHDITDYENGARISRSPLTFLPHLDKSRLEDSDLLQLLESQLFQKWSKKKQQSNALPILLWFLLRASIYITCLISYTNTEPYYRFIEQRGFNLSDALCPGLDRPLNDQAANSLRYILIITSITFLLFDICDLISNKLTKWNKATCMEIRGTITDHNFFRRCQFATNLVLAIWFPLDVVNESSKIWQGENGSYAILPLYLLPILLSWSMLYFMQILPFLGVAINSMQQMVRDTVHFMVLYIIFLVPFYIIFQNYMLAYSKSGCTEDFKDDVSSLFTLYLMMLQIVDPREYDVRFEDGLRFIFLIYTFMCAVILLNFLLALMANTASKSENDNVIILRLNRLAVSCLVEKRWYWLFHQYYLCMRKMFYDVDSEGKVYIVTSENRYPNVKTNHLMS